MKNQLTVFLLISFLLGAAACSKEGPAGPQGEQGTTGEKGETGAQGIPGTDGNLLLYGNLAPSGTQGKEGDFYIDKQNNLLYGPKTEDGWGKATILQGEKGDKGDKGEAGSQFISGSGSPAADAGRPGDFYFDSANGILFGPKSSANAWPVGVGLKGEKGDRGEKGDKGADGNANVSVYTVSIRDSVWSVSGKYDYLRIVAPQVLTANTVADDVILVYVRTTDYGSWSLVPYYTSREIRVEVDINVRYLELRKAQDGTPGTQSSFSDVRVVVLKATSAEALMKRGERFKDYEKLKAMLQLGG